MASDSKEEQIYPQLYGTSYLFVNYLDFERKNVYVRTLRNT
jgi:hypothetical protein